MCFFFKQKTAYEMRISDWSSDVCSSDLDRRDATRCARQPRVEHDALADVEARSVGTAADDLADDFVAHHLRERAQPAHGGVGIAFEVEQDQLGRVACREWVCQFE